MHHKYLTIIQNIMFGWIGMPDKDEEYPTIKMDGCIH